MAAELARIDPDLCFEFGSNAGKPDSEREFVISAGGIKRAFPAVVALAAAAPKIPRWQVIAFRPRRTIDNVIDYEGTRVSYRDVWFALLDNGKNAGLQLFLPHFRESDTALKMIGYLFLDTALGEYDVETRLGLIEMLSTDTPDEFQRHPLVDLPEQFDSLVARLDGSSGKPS